MKNKKLLVVGELNVDLILNKIKGLPTLGEEKLADTFHITLGSSSAIFAANISTLGTDTTFVGRIGDDNFGRFVLDDLKLKQVNVDHISVDPSYQTGVTVVMNYDNDRANVTYCGAMEHLTIEDIPWESLSKYGHLHLSNYFLQKGLQNDIVEIFRRAKHHGLSTSLDLQVDPDEKWEFDYKSCLPYVDIFLPNEFELINLVADSNIENALKEIGNYGNIIALKQSTKGSILYIKNQSPQSFAPYLHDRFIDAIGAGDSFNAGFLHQYLKGKSLEKCMDYANLMGAINTTGPGGTGAFQNMESVEKTVKETFTHTF
ncbi:carbohydrate kinase family protein [Litoribacter ruber]|uniref:carbohydrate kinase family protein n=1 Tax=Litoribacter ruber TaxID=702568 RepID=UPI001BDB2259|nr:carbohydrate kinase family protein [Litoribacter ruber]MBT0812876.1 carbohydrate kinase family protein [Litoribacter ruber]